ncbi:unnamed protein product [Caenorhabditis brenneri]
MIKTEFLAAFFVLVAAVSAQGIVGPGVPVCNGNETFTTCQKCDAYCTNLTYTCQEECSVGCLCNPGYVRDLQNKCIKIEDCPATVQCGANEELNLCYNTCEEEKCFSNIPADLCPKLEVCTIGCSCRGGFVRDPSGKCVKPAQCDTNTTNPCDSEKCGCGEECVVVNVPCRRPPCQKVAECHPIATDCSNKKCTTPEGCAMVQTLNCDKPKCPKTPMCINENQCLYTRCPRGFQCELQEDVKCDNPPCEPVAQCVMVNNLDVELIGNL